MCEQPGEQILLVVQESLTLRREQLPADLWGMGSFPLSFMILVFSLATVPLACALALSRPSSKQMSHIYFAQLNMV